MSLKEEDNQKTETQKSIGTVHHRPMGRDAIHVAVAQVSAAEVLYPGQSIGLTGEGTKVSASAVPKQGIVDPFLRSRVQEGDLFWMFLAPNTITSLRHEWTHPAFGPELPKPQQPAWPNVPGVAKDQWGFVESMAWLIKYAERFDINYAELMAAAKAWIDHEDYFTLGFDTPEEELDLFWHHYEKVTGTIVPANRKEEGFFSCAC